MRSLYYFVINCAVITSGSAYAVGPGFLPPFRFEAKSSSGRFVAEITPRGDYVDLAAHHSMRKRYGRYCALRLYEERESQRTFLWEVELSNDRAPSEVFVTDDGEFAVTLGNWATDRTRDDVLAFYNQRGQIRQVLISSAPTLDSRKESHQTYGLRMVTSVGGRARLCIWDSSSCQWLAWSVSNAEFTDLNESLIRQCNHLARQLALGRIRRWSELRNRISERVDMYPSWKVLEAYEFLADRKVAEDHQLFEELLRTGEFTTYQSSNNYSKCEFVATSQVRILADRMLARWDRPLIEKPQEQVGDDSRISLIRDSDYKHQLLGTISGIVRLPIGASRMEGPLWLYLVPDTKMTVCEWDRCELIQRMRMNAVDLRMNTSNDVRFVLHGVTPGRYWIKTVWSRERVGEREDEIGIPKEGDYESSERSIIDVIAGQTIENMCVKCDAEVRH